MAIAPKEGEPSVAAIGRNGCSGVVASAGLLCLSRNLSGHFIGGFANSEGLGNGRTAVCVGDADGVFASLQVLLCVDAACRGGYGHIAVGTADGDVVVFGAAANLEGEDAVAFAFASYRCNVTLLCNSQLVGFANGLHFGCGGAAVAVFHGYNVVASAQRRDVIVAIGSEGSLKRAAQAA